MMMARVKQDNDEGDGTERRRRNNNAKTESNKNKKVCVGENANNDNAMPDESGWWGGESLHVVAKGEQGKGAQEIPTEFVWQG